jgi:predicted nucleic acid-binding protein
MPVEYLTPAIEDRAVEVQAALADRGLHRAPSVPDLVIAATAELAGLTVLHLEPGVCLRYLLLIAWSLPQSFFLSA